MSDLHVDFPKALPVPAAADGCGVVLVAGDTCEGLAKAVETLRRAFPRTEVVMVAGNHEYYGHVFEDELNAGRRRAEALGVHLLENAAVSFGNVTVIGATLWTDFELFGEGLRIPAMRTAAQTMRDHRKICWRKRPWARFRPQEARALHVQSRRFIERELAEADATGRTAVVMTHHAASIEAIAPIHRQSLVAAAFASELRPLIDSHQPAWWISGHTHWATSFRRGICTVISNPRGYPGEATGFDPSLLINVAVD